ncbi:MAG: peptide-methionine (S)-S-oxide reductase MsrA [Clostridium sp.]|jgi:peptide-methionine (S)-S-oxide reductase|uniref:peptide-methionine (S)-S-oxide reductase MsrA n=1 Tax=Clostridium sp. TaxID=1506 RepID=UPI0025C1017D|nr:peptide-methionine (S)-S-oxide reductase MsrA [Clostridium sp.]MCH3963331.1 peptide-methionine (S)-S-oxide reductase MsrA [Clostridium sp.]MCI1716801.1 peptide-methionine (S)-S-oxide reductase MsrA [Clostridium sp.]MCI1801015.1 peptide-methionine (S)-S-oxide reductase MsrA [Clostridium sp.]MCI1814987.1 peptide-methionine (S)-S-oxide reductase MsrA [Clostridium sp.]MCI1871888.1 peptide-methionine (S)-S-oxide reductase MsrA [Clostridium sp.]
MKSIVFAGGCFWGVQAYFDSKKGVLNTKVGYANGNGKKPGYEEVCSGNTGFVEACFLEYDSRIIELEKLLEVYWRIIDPTLLDRQGNDIGNQYRTGIYYIDKSDVNIIEKFIKTQQKNYSKKIVTEVLPLENFYDAEEYHQKYLEKNPGGYCHIPKELINRRL